VVSWEVLTDSRETQSVPSQNGPVAPDYNAFKLPQIALTHTADANTGDIEFLAGRAIPRPSQNLSPP